MSPEELDLIATFAGSSDSAPSNTTSTLGLIGRNLANLLPRTIGSLEESTQALADPVRYQGKGVPSELKLPDFATPAIPQTGFQKIADVLLGGVAPEIAAAMVPYLLTGGASGTASGAAIGNVAQGLFSGVRESDSMALKQGLLSGTLGKISEGSTLAKRLLMGAPVAAADAAMSPDGYGMVAAGSDLASVLFHAKYERPGTSGSTATTTIAPQGPLKPSPEMVGGVSEMKLATNDFANLQTPVQTSTLDQIPKQTETSELERALILARQPSQVPSIPSVLQMPKSQEATMRLVSENTPSFAEVLNQGIPFEGQTGLKISSSTSPLASALPEAIVAEKPANQYLYGKALGNQYRESANLQSPFIEAPKTNRGLITGLDQEPIFAPKITEPGYQLPSGPIIAGSDLPRNRKTSVFNDLGLPNNANTEAAIEAERALGRRGKMRSLPEYKRTEGGVISSELRNSLGGGIVGGAIGASLGRQYADKFGMDPDEASALFAGAGFATGMGIMRLTSFKPSTLGRVGGMKQILGQSEKSESGGIFVGPRSKKWEQVKANAEQLPEVRDTPVVHINGSVASTLNISALTTKAAKANIMGIPQATIKAINYLHPSRKEFVRTPMEEYTKHNLQGTLFEHYPQLKNVNIEFSNADPNAAGRAIIYDAEKGNAKIVINPSHIMNSANPEKTLTETLTHEFNHVIQEIEQHPGGTSPAYYMDLIDDEGKAYTMYMQTHGEMMARMGAKAEVDPIFAQRLKDQGIGRVWEYGRERVGLKPGDEAYQLYGDKGPKAEASAPMAKPRQKESGQLSTEYGSTISGAIAGGLIGYQKDGTEGAIAGTILGGTGGLLLNRTLQGLQRISPGLKPASDTPFATLQKTTKESFAGVKRALNSNWKDLAGEDVTGRGGILSKTIRILEDQFRLNMPQELKTVITQSRGFASEIVDRAHRSLREISRIELPNEIKNTVNTFLDGKLISATEEEGLLSSVKALDKDTFEKLSRTGKQDYQKWQTTDGKEYYVPRSSNIKSQFLSRQEDALMKSLPAEFQQYGDQIIEARRSMNEFQTVLSNALPQGRLKDLIDDSVGKYVPRLFRQFTDDKYRPTDDQISKAMVEFGFNKKAQDLETAISKGTGYEANKYLERVASLQKSDPTGRLEKLKEFQKVNANGKDYYLDPTEASSLRKYDNPHYLEKEVTSYLQELQANRHIMNNGHGLDKTMFTERDNISPAFRDMLGEYTDPVERMAMGVAKMYAPAQAGRLISAAKELKIDGIPIAFSDDNWSRAIQAAEQSGNAGQFANLQSYVKLPKDIQYGEYAGLYVNRFLADHFRGDARVWDTAIGRHMANLNQFFKTTHIPLNPVTQVRQWISLPAFALIGKATPAALGQAGLALKNVDSAMRKELLQQGIWTADFIRGELHGSVDNIMGGKYDSELMKKVKGGYEKILDWYRMPDMLVRGGTYISAKNRISKQLGKEINDPEVMRLAVEWTDRYTMNYDNIAKVVRNARNIPLVNPFISFQAEMLRIVKNLAVDGVTKNPERLAVLGGLVAFFDGLSIAGEQSLSSEDQKKWAQTKANLPDYMKYQALMPTRRRPDGNFDYVSFSPIVPYDNLEQTVRAAAAGDKDALSTLNPFFSTQSSPLFNAITELVSGEDKQTGLKFRNNTEAISNIVSDFLPPIAPGGYEWKRLANVNVRNLKTGRVQDWGDVALRYTTGVSSGDINPDATLRAAAGKLRRDIADLRDHYMGVAKMDVSDDDKRAAYDDYRQGTELLLRDFAKNQVK